MSIARRRGNCNSARKNQIRPPVDLPQHGLRAAVLAEDGCLQYDYFLPVGKEDCVLLIEHWRNQSALDKHSAGEPMAKLKALIKDFPELVHIST